MGNSVAGRNAQIAGEKMRKKVIQQYQSMLDELSDLTGAKAARKEREIIKFMRESAKGQKTAIRDAYEANKDRIDDFTPGMSNKSRWQGFYDNVAATMIQMNMSAKNAIKKQLNSANYQSKANVFKQNTLAAIRHDKTAYQEWRNLTQRQKISMDSLEYIGDNTYQYTIEKKTLTRIITISFDNSPERISISASDIMKEKNKKQ